MVTDNASVTITLFLTTCQVESGLTAYNVYSRCARDSLEILNEFVCAPRALVECWTEIICLKYPFSLGL